jgi:hypothetical protein
MPICHNICPRSWMFVTLLGGKSGNWTFAGNAESASAANRAGIAQLHFEAVVFITARL